uniref:Ribosomal protein L31 n=1 Tax=Pseudochorda nagaii TaxID=74379 RepID=A0A8F0FCY6_9PHAE|nr:ribosomal protein L31 [Pseudochorda nagaii]
MKSSVKSKLFGGLVSDGSFSFLVLPCHTTRSEFYCTSLDIVNHPVWTGRRAKEQTEIASFIGRFTKVK